MSLILPVRVQAQVHEQIEIKSEWKITAPENVVHRPTDEVIEKLRQDAIRQARPRVTQTNNGKYSCVAWAKKVTGVFGTWGDGGHYLSLNSTGLVGDVVIFKGMHVAVVIGRVGEKLTITEANYDWKGSVRTRTLLTTSSTIKGFHRF